MVGGGGVEIDAVLGVACDDSSEVWCERKLELPQLLGAFVRFALALASGHVTS